MAAVTRTNSTIALNRRSSQGASRSAFGVRRSTFVLVLVLVLERCCLQKGRVNPIRSAKPELHPCGRGVGSAEGGDGASALAP